MIVTIFNDSRRDTTGYYVNKALAQLRKDFVHINPLRQAIPEGADLYLMIDDGVSYSLKGQTGKLAYWAIDTHFTPEQCIKKAECADWVFRAQKNGDKVLPNSIWLPLACSTEDHGVHPDMIKVYDVCFIGNTHTGSMGRRIDCLDVLFKKFPNFYYGNRTFNDMAQKYNQSRIVFNCSLNNDINMRVFEAMCSGSLLLTDVIHDNGFEEIGLLDGRNCVTYKDNDEMVKEVEFYLANPKEREAIARRGKEWAFENTYKKRVEKILEIVGGK